MCHPMFELDSLLVDIPIKEGRWQAGNQLIVIEP